MSKTDSNRLKRRLKDQHRLMDQERESKKHSPNIRMEEETPDRLKAFDFWCVLCEEDFSAPCIKTKHRLYGDMIAIWRASCPYCEEDCIRHITHKDEDPYYQQSDKIRRQRNEYAWDMLSPDQPGFRTSYGEPYKDFIKKQQRLEEDIIKQARDQGLRGDSVETRTRLKKLNLR